MKKTFIWFTLFFMISIFTACEEKQPEKSITIEPYELSEEEKTLVSKTGISFIEYFKLHGKISETEDLVFEVEFYKNGKLDHGPKTFGMIDREFDHEIVSFGMMDYPTSEETMITLGSPGGIVATSYEIEVSGSTYGKLLGEKITLKKDQPVYLAGWKGTNNHTVTGFHADNGQFPEDALDSELAILYKVTLTDRDDVE